jgi:hypothetical protein
MATKYFSKDRVPNQAKHDQERDDEEDSALQRREGKEHDDQRPSGCRCANTSAINGSSVTVCHGRLLEIRTKS